MIGESFKKPEVLSSIVAKKKCTAKLLRKHDVIPPYGTLSYLQLFHHQAQQPANLVPLLYPYLADWIYLSLILGYCQLHPILFGGLGPNTSEEECQQARQN
jgi:hypothetical protein